MQKVEACGGRAKALVAAKKVYFGVGGGITGFLTELRKQGGSGEVIWETTGTGAGVERCILEVHRVSAVPGVPALSDQVTENS